MVKADDKVMQAEFRIVVMSGDLIKVVYKTDSFRFLPPLFPASFFSHEFFWLTKMSFALPARQVTFGRPAAVAPYQPQQAQAPQKSHTLALPGSSSAPAPALVSAPAPAPTPVAVPAPVVATAPAPPIQPQPLPNAAAATPSTPVPLTLEQQHITAVEGIVPTLQNIVATVNLDCKLDLKTIALHARNAEYNPKVSSTRSLCTCARQCALHDLAFRGGHHAHS